MFRTGLLGGGGSCGGDGGGALYPVEPDLNCLDLVKEVAANFALDIEVEGR